MNKFYRSALMVAGTAALLFVLQVVAGDANDAIHNIRTSNLKSIADLRASVLEGVREETSQTEVVSSAYVSTSTSPDFYRVADVVDGDTIKVILENPKEAGGGVASNAKEKPATLRLIGMDTPEVVDPRKPVQCFGKEASAKAKELLLGKSVQLEFDESQGVTDKYGRTLAYVRLGDGTLFNEYMIEQGYAFEYTYRVPYKYQAEFKQVEKDARTSGRGLWSASTCNGVAGDASNSHAAPTSRTI